MPVKVFVAGGEPRYAPVQHRKRYQNRAAGCSTADSQRRHNALGDRNNRHVTPIGGFFDLGIVAYRRRSWATVEGSVAVPPKGLAPPRRGRLPGVSDKYRGSIRAPTLWQADDGALTRSCDSLCTRARPSRRSAG